MEQGVVGRVLDGAEAVEGDVSGFGDIGLCLYSIIVSKLLEFLLWSWPTETSSGGLALARSLALGFDQNVTCYVIVTKAACR